MDSDWAYKEKKKSWNHHPTTEQVYGHLPPISKTIQIRWTRPDSVLEVGTNS